MGHQREIWAERVRSVLGAKTDDFRELISLATLNPREDLRFQDWSGCNFAGCDLRSFDFTASRLHNCKFERALIAGARFDQAEINGANLRAAKDWKRYVKSWRRAERSPSGDHLPVGAVFQDAPFAPEMIVIPAGKFIADKTISQDEVTIPKGFAVSRYAVTFDEWDAAVAAGGVKHNPKDEGWGRGRRPVINISFDDARAYVAWLSATTASHYRLLFQSEWEYVCRGGTTGAFGDVIREDQANFISDRTKKVGSYAANVFGVYDMHGNVDEWCNDGWDFRTIEPATVPARGFRGGSWRDESKTHWSVFTIGPNGRYNHVGLRVARTTCG